MSETTSAITEAVGALYDAFPYPRYPLFAPLRWQEGHLGASLAAARLMATMQGIRAPVLTQAAHSVLVAGCGEVEPYILRHWEPRAHVMVCVDIAAKSLLRARLRLMRPWARPNRFLLSDLESFLRDDPTMYAHADAFGVLHHLAAPDAAIQALGARMLPGATVRIMLYNNHARAWIHHLQRAFASLNLDPFTVAGRNMARNLLQEFARDAPSIASRLKAMGSATLANDARLVDTFFHVREARIPLARWLMWFRAAGLQPAALLDRYGEMDHLENPLWRLPSDAVLEGEAARGAFAGNWELWLVKDGGEQDAHHMPPPRRAWWNARLHLTSAPRRWFDFPETATIAPRLRARLWRHYINYITGAGPSELGSLARFVSHRSLQRLTRIGAVLPGQVTDAGLFYSLMQPLARVSSAYDWGSAQPLTKTGTERLVRTMVDDDRRFETVMARLDRAQR